MGQGTIMGGAGQPGCQVGGRAAGGADPETWATEEEVGKKVNSKIINRGEGRGERIHFNIQALH